jgi:serine protease Do
MSERNDSNQGIFNAEYSERRSQNPMRNPNKKNHPVLTIALSAVIAAVCGVGGGWFAWSHLGGSTDKVNVSYSQAMSTSETTTVANDSDKSTMTVSQVAAKASPSVVEIQTEITQTSYGLFGGTFTSEAAGSGVIISTDGYIITNNHVIEDANSIKVTTYDGTEYAATLVGTDEKSDIAVIKVDAENLTAAVIGNSSQIEAGDTAVVIGNPLGTLGGTVTSGIISSPSRELVINNESMELIQTNASINSGNSGGGLFDGNGNLVGIVNAKDSGTTSSGATIEGIGFAIPVNTAMDVAQELITNGRVTDRATIGISLQELSQPTGRYEAGLYITNVMKGSGAEKAGLQAFDRITGVEGKDISTYAELSAVLRTKKVGDTITLTIVRDGETKDVDVTLTAVLDESTGAVQNRSSLG